MISCMRRAWICWSILWDIKVAYFLIWYFLCYRAFINFIFDFGANCHFFNFAWPGPTWWNPPRSIAWICIFFLRVDWRCRYIHTVPASTTSAWSAEQYSLRNTPRWPPLNVTFRKIPGSINFTLDFGSNWSVLKSQTTSVPPIGKPFIEMMWGPGVTWTSSREIAPTRLY